MLHTPAPNAAARLRKEACDPPSKGKPTRKTLLRLLGIARPYWWQLGLLMAALTLELLPGQSDRGTAQPPDQ